MKQLHPAICTGLAYAAVHQAIALCGVASVFLSEYVFMLFAIGFYINDFPAIWLSGALGLEAWCSPFMFNLNRHLPGGGRDLGYPIVLVLTLGAAQWFLIGCAASVRRARRAARKQLR